MSLYLKEVKSRFQRGKQGPEAGIFLFQEWQEKVPRAEHRRGGVIHGVVLKALS